MGAALSAAVMPCTRVPVTITVSAPPASWAMAGAAKTANADTEAPTSKEFFKFSTVDFP